MSHRHVMGMSHYPHADIVKLYFFLVCVLIRVRRTDTLSDMCHFGCTGNWSKHHNVSMILNDCGGQLKMAYTPLAKSVGTVTFCCLLAALPNAILNSITYCRNSPNSHWMDWRCPGLKKVYKALTNILWELSSCTHDFFPLVFHLPLSEIVGRIWYDLISCVAFNLPCIKKYYFIIIVIVAWSSKYYIMLPRLLIPCWPNCKSCQPPC